MNDVSTPVISDLLMDMQTPSRSAEANVQISVTPPASSCEPRLALGGTRPRFFADPRRSRALVNESDPPGTLLAQLHIEHCDLRLLREVQCEVNRFGVAFSPKEQQVRVQRPAESDTTRAWRLEIARAFDREAEAESPVFHVRCVHPSTFSQSNQLRGVDFVEFSYELALNQIISTHFKSNRIVVLLLRV